METAAKKQSWAIILFTIGVFMGALDNGIISAALTTINSNFNVDPTLGSWGITLYTLGLAVSVPIVGKLSDRYGRRRLFLIEVALFGLGSLLVAMSVNFEMFLFARLLQSLGGGGFFIIGSSYILATLPKEQQGKALGILGGMNGIAAVLGPNIGSFILDLTGSWHWLFLINVPIALALVVLGYFKIKETAETEERTNAPLDFKGTILLSLSILSVMYAITKLEGFTLGELFGNTEVIVFLAIGIALFIILVLFEGRLERLGKDPVLPITLLRKPQYLLTLFIGVCSGGLIAAVIFVPAYAEQFLGIAAAKSGYWMTPLAVASGIGAGLGGAVVDRKGPIVTVVTSGIVSIIGFALFPLWVDGKVSFIIASCIAGVGFGMLLGAPINVLATEPAGHNKGSALGTLSLFKTIGLTIAPTIYAGFLTRSFNDIPNRIAENLSAIGFDMSKVPMQGGGAGDFQQMLDKLASMPPIPGMPPVADIIKVAGDTTRTVAGEAYGGLFMAATVIAILILVTGIILKFIRKDHTI